MENDDRDDFQKKIDNSTDELMTFFTTRKGVAIVILFVLGIIGGLILTFVPA